MKPNLQAMERAMMIARQIAERIDPAYSGVRFPPVSGGIPEEYQQGGVVDPDFLKNLAKSAVSAINKGRAGLAEGGEAGIPPRQLNRMGFYSGASEAAMALPQEVGTPQQMIASLKGVKPDELEHSGVNTAFADKPKITKQELADHFRKSLPPVMVKPLYDDDSESALARYGEDYNIAIPGGQNYREHLIRLDPIRYQPRNLPPVPEYTPQEGLTAERADVRQYGGAYHINDADGNEIGMVRGFFNTPEDAVEGWHQGQQKELDQAYNRLATFSSPHYPETDNVLAHVRMSDRKGPNGEKILHLEEVQSDWGQKGRETGFENDIKPGEVAKEEGRDTWRVNWPDGSYSAGYGSVRSANEAMKRRFLSKANYIPKGPYVDNTSKWTDLAMKHVLNEAAQNNYDHIIWTPGQAQADRYDLSQAIDGISHAQRPDNTYDLGARNEDGHQLIKTRVPAKELSNYVGKEIAQKILDGHGDEVEEHDLPEGTNRLNWKEISGLDLKVGGEGMKGFYDNIMPKRLLTLAREHDPSAKLEKLDHPEQEIHEFPMLKITPEMRESIKKKGFKAFATGGTAMPKPLDKDKAIRRAMMLARGGFAIGGEPPALPVAAAEEQSMSTLRKRGPRSAPPAVELAKEIQPEMPMVRGQAVQPAETEQAASMSIPKFDPEVYAPSAVSKAPAQSMREAPSEPMPEMRAEPMETAAPPPSPEESKSALESTPKETRGLPFPSEEAAFRLRTKLNREAKIASGKKADPGLPSNPRMVIRAPSAEEGGKQLPDFVLGQVTPQDWVERHEKILTPDEMKHSADWYKNIYGNFLNYTNDNEQEARKLMRAWLVAQQNTSPATAMQNVLLQREQMERGVPEHLWRAGGMPNPTSAARSVLRDQPISGGVGQKISDFVDSAEGLDTRSYLGHASEGGTPFVIDVHSARDTGLVDPALINHLRGLGYNEEDLAKVKTDFEASPSDAQYESRAQWGRDLTDHLNSIGWQGKKDWRPEEIQAIGWMGMTKLTRNAEEDSASGLGRNLRRVSFELAPGEGSPWEAKYGQAFNTLPDEDRATITERMSGRAMELANDIAKTYAVNMVHGTGAWMQYQNPAAVAQVLATQEGADLLAHSVGHMLHQTEVWHNRVKPVTANPKGFAIDFIEQGSKNLADKGQLKDFWQKVLDADDTGLIQGYQPITLPSGQVGVRVLVDKGGKKTAERLSGALQQGGKLDSILQSLPFDVESQIAEAEISKARNDWKENPNGQAYVQRIREITGSDPSARLGAAGSQLAEELEGFLDEAYAKQGRSWRPEGQDKVTKAKKGRGKAAPMPEPTAGMASGGIVDRALRVASQARRQ
jgi:hypothetical protein